MAGCYALLQGRAVGKLSEAEWLNLFHRCVKERSVTLAWARSQARIETEASRTVALKWAASVWDVQDRYAAHLAALAEVTEWWAAHDIPYVVLKGIPLAQRLYGVPWARPADDLDVFILPDHRESALQVLQATGWVHRGGEFPADLVFQKVVRSNPITLDIHFSLSGPWHRHLPLPGPTSEICVVEGREIRTAGGDFLPAYLAAHLLQHDRRPLLWLMDFATLRGSFTDEQWGRVRHAARGARLHRVLDMVSGWAKELEQLAAFPGSEAEQAFTDRVLRPSPRRAVMQVVSSCASPADFIGVLSRAVWPRELRGSPSGLVALWVRRVSKQFAR